MFKYIPKMRQTARNAKIDTSPTFQKTIKSNNINILYLWM